MSKTPENRKTLAGWTMVDSKGELMSDDSRSVSSESSTESFSLLQEDSTRDADTPSPSVDLPSEDVNDELATSFPFALSVSQMKKVEVEKIRNDPAGSDDNEDSSPSDQISKPVLEPVDAESLPQSTDVMRVGTSCSVPDAADDPIEKDGGLGACCEELMENAQGTSNQQNDVLEYEDDLEDKEESNDGAPTISLDADDSISSPDFLYEDRRELRQRHNSDSDSDFVQINEDNLEEFEAEITQNRGAVPNRSPSIADEFNFLGREEERIQEELPGSGNVSEEDFNEDTESSTEDAGDDRIESDQSEAGSAMNNNPTDVADLSAFADIADLPIIAGNVARNYRHRPNKGLSSVLNIILIVVSLLTMGISIGLIMATDLEIEEWQNAYNMQTKKTSSLEWALADFDRAVQESKARVDAHESVLESFAKAESQDTGTSMLFKNIKDIVTNFESCSGKHGSLSSVDCHALVLPDVRRSLSQFKQGVKTDNKATFDLPSAARSIVDAVTGVFPKEKEIHSSNDGPTLDDLKLSIQREQERALHWQNLYLLERRQREWERENEDLEDQRERAQWEKEDEEEDRRMREKWEREEAENDRKERLMWEREDQEQDRRERERWEKERADIDNLECLKKLMSSNLTVFRQHIMNWNVSAFDDFVNVSTLMLGIAEMKQSVLASVQQIWAEAEEALNKMGEDVKNGKQTYLDTSVMADYLRQALSILRSQFDDVVNVQTNDMGEKEKAEKSKSLPRKEKNGKGSEGKYESAAGKGFKIKTESRKESNIWNEMLGKIFKKTSKSLRKFVRTVTSSWAEVMTHWEKRASGYVKLGKTVLESPDDSSLLPSWLLGKSCQDFNKKQYGMLHLGSPCAWEVREILSSNLLQEPCDPNNRYSLACNIDRITLWQYNRDLKRILDADSSFRAKEMSSVGGAYILELLVDFWKKWENTELLLKFDKDWVACSLKEWSDAIYSKNGWTKATGANCGRFISLKTFAMDVNSWKTTHFNGQSKRHLGDTVVEDKGEYSETVEGEDSVIDSDEDTRTGNNYQPHFNLFENASYDVNNAKPKSRDLNQMEKRAPEKIRQIKRNVSYDDALGTERYNYKQTVWYLKRAQYRLEMRRARQKANWFFEMSDNRDEMRKEHAMEKKSAQWLFDLAEDREDQRKKDCEADWIFDRARHRRKESSRKWATDRQLHKCKGQVKDADDHWEPGSDCFVSREKRNKIKELSESDWLLQNNGGRGQGSRKGENGKKRSKKWEKAVRNANKKVSHRAGKMNINKHGNPDHQHKGKKHKNRKHFQKKY